MLWYAFLLFSNISMAQCYISNMFIQYLLCSDISRVQCNKWLNSNIYEPDMNFLLFHKYNTVKFVYNNEKPAVREDKMSVRL